MANRRLKILPPDFAFSFKIQLAVVAALVAAALIIVFVTFSMGPRVNGTGLNTAGTSSRPTSGTPIVDVIGDSYVSGSDQGGRGGSNWTKLVGSKFYDQGTPIEMTVTAEPGAGYVVRSGKSVTFGEAAIRSLRQNADLVVVLGGRNDGVRSEKVLGEAARSMYAEIHKRSPHAKLIIIGPIWVDSNVPTFIRNNSEVLKVEALTANATFVDPITDGWFFGKNSALIGADGIHPTDAGHAYMASLMFPVISDALGIPLSSTSTSPSSGGTAADS